MNNKIVIVKTLALSNGDSSGSIIVKIQFTFPEGVQEVILREAQRAKYDDPRVAGGPDVLSESAR